jgi:hypothetical protein
MALKGQAKTDYQREYMRKRRAKEKGSNIAKCEESLTIVRGNYPLTTRRLVD